MVYQILQQVQRLLLPPTCVLCGADGEAWQKNRQGVDLSISLATDADLCAACRYDLPVNANACEQCAEQLPLSGRSSTLCGACLRRAPRFQQAHCAYRYSYPIDHLVRALKYHGRLAYARVLGSLLARSLVANRTDDWPQMLLPTPLANARFRERGFNQAVEIAAQLERQLQIPMRADVLIRHRATLEQAGLDRITRRKNVRGAFALHAQPAEHVAIVDDVITTGSTMNEMARDLKRAGVQRIEVWAVARASR